MTDWLLLQNSLFHQLYILTVGNCLEIIKKGIYRYAWCDEKLSIDWPGYLPQLQTLDRLVKQCIQCGLFSSSCYCLFCLQWQVLWNKKATKMVKYLSRPESEVCWLFLCFACCVFTFLRFLFSLLFYRNISAFFS